MHGLVPPAVEGRESTYLGLSVRETPPRPSHLSLPRPSAKMGPSDKRRKGEGGRGKPFFLLLFLGPFVSVSWAGLSLCVCLLPGRWEGSRGG